MNSFEINKILGALLGTCLLLLAVHIASGAIFTQPVPAKPGYEVAVKEEQPGKQEAAKPADQPIETLLVSASVEHGAQVAKQCAICHNLQEGQGPKIGPDLYGVVGRQVASIPSFNYSAALKAMRPASTGYSFTGRHSRAYNAKPAQQAASATSTVSRSMEMSTAGTKANDNPSHRG